MIYISDRSARNFMRYSISGLYYPQSTDVAQLRFYQVDPAVITDPVKMAAIKAAFYLNTTSMGSMFVDIGSLYATMAYDESLNLIRVKSLETASQAAENTGVGTVNLCVVVFGNVPYGSTGAEVEAAAPVAALPVGAGRPVELINNGVFTAAGQPLKLKTFALRLKGY